MSNSTPDMFSWRDGGFQFKIGSEDEGGTKAVLTIDGKLHIVTQKNIHSILLADSVDPQRTNASIPHTQQTVFAYGTDEPFVGRTLLQAEKLFERHALPENIDTEKGLSIAFSFLKQIANLHEMVVQYAEKEKEQKQVFQGNIGAAESLRLPSIGDVEKRVIEMINGVDHAKLCIIDTIKLFYPDIENGNWVKRLKEEYEKKKDRYGEDAVNFFEHIGKWSLQARNLRNAIEHSKPDNRIEVKNYILEKNGKIQSPTISLVHKDTPFAGVPVSTFLTEMVEGLLMCYENTLAYLCDAHVMPFAENERSVIEAPLKNRSTDELHIKFGYHIKWIN